MIKHTCELKDTIEYRMCYRTFIMFLSVQIFLLGAIFGLIVFFFVRVPTNYALIGSITVVVIFSPTYILLFYDLYKISKRAKFLKQNYHLFEEVLVTLSLPITVGFGRVKYNIRFKAEDNLNVELLSNDYSPTVIDGDKMLIGYNKEDREIIFLKSA